MEKLKRNIYIENTELKTAINKYNDSLEDSWKLIELETGKALHYVTAEPVFAKVSSPFYNASAMDGIMIQHELTQGASEMSPRIISHKNFRYVNTGNAIVEPYDAVIMIEDIVEVEGGISIIQAAHPWQHIRPIGEDVVVGEMILPSRHEIRAIDLGALISGGIEYVKVYQKPMVGILPTGNEIISKIADIHVGTIIDSNSSMFEGLISEIGGTSNRYEPVSDDYELLKEAILKGVRENDILIINAGSSAGSKDYTVHLIRELGEVIVHGVGIKPGKPTILGLIDKKPVVGIPGYPVSAYISFDYFVKPLLLKAQGKISEVKRKLDVVVSKRIVSSFKHEETVRVTIGKIKDKYVATPLNRGAGTTMSLVRADGLIKIPKSCEGLEASEVVSATLLKPLEEIEETLLSIGSHDLILDMISEAIPLSSGHVGSLGGILALKRNECHIAPIHILDEKTGSYNIQIVKQFFNNEEMILIKGVKRKQGFIVKKGNPKQIRTIEDLTKENIVFANRQSGAGTRLLLDYHLNKEQIDTSSIKGYRRELVTHMAVAVAVSSQTADVGLGIYAAAKAMDLDFIFFGWEDYDFLIRKELLQDPRITHFIETLQSSSFKDQCESIGGYETAHSGEVIEI